MNFDERERAMEQKIIDDFAKYEKRETCPMCKAHLSFEEKLGKKESEEMFLQTFEEREHDQMICFMDCFMFCTVQETIHLQAKDIRKMAMERYDSIAKFVMAIRK